MCNNNKYSSRILLHVRFEMSHLCDVSTTERPVLIMSRIKFQRNLRAFGSIPVVGSSWKIPQNTVWKLGRHVVEMTLYLQFTLIAVPVVPLPCTHENASQRQIPKSIKELKSLQFFTTWVLFLYLLKWSSGLKMSTPEMVAINPHCTGKSSVYKLWWVFNR